MDKLSYFLTNLRLQLQILQIIIFDVILWMIEAIIPHIRAHIIKTVFFF